MASSDVALEKISAELKHLSLKRQQLLERKKMQCIFQELRNHVGFEQTEEASNLHEIDSIDEQLNQLTQRKVELQEHHDSIFNAEDKKNIKEASFTSSLENEPPPPPPPPLPEQRIFYVDAPPTFPAPTVILDLEKLPTCPCRTQCPECRQFVLTETFTSVSSVTWMVCFMTAVIGCAAGCCFIPFCLDKFKSTTHRCPKCRTLIQTIKKL